MYKTVDTYLGKNDVNSAMEECVRNNLCHLGALLGRIAGNGDGKFHTLLGQLESGVKGVTPVVTQPVVTQPVVTQPVVKTVRLLCNWQTTHDLSELWNKMSKGNYTWDNIKLVWTGEADYYVVINCPPINEFPPPSKTIVFRMEPNMHLHPELWGDWAKPNPALFVKVCCHEDEYNNNEWHLSKTYTELKSSHPEKKAENDGIISTVLSAKYRDPGHIKRIDFVKFLEQKEMPVHVYGDNKWEYQDFKGSLPYHCKDDAVFPYKYTFNVENHSMQNYFTEKIIDGILGETLVFYSGCFNLKEFLPEDAFVYLELSNFEKDYETVKKAIEEDWWSKRLPAIREAKRIILDELQFFPRVKRIIEEHESKKN